MDRQKKRDRIRANGEGWKKKRKDGRGYDVGLHIPGPNGEMVRKATIIKRSADADAWLTREKAARDGGAVLTGENPRLSAYLSVWLEDSVRGSVAAVTYKHYRRMVENHIVPVLGSVKIKALTPRHVQRLHAIKRDEGLSVATRRHVHITLSKALSQAAAWGEIPANPAAVVKLPKAPAGKQTERANRIRPYSEDELQRLIRAAEGTRYHALYVFAPATGLREQELCALRWSNLVLPDSEPGTVRVVEAVIETELGFEVGPPKTKKSKRAVEFPSRVVAAMREHRKRQLEERVKARRWEERDLVFPNAYGGLLNRYRLGHHFRPMRERAGLDQAHQFRDLRHTFATLMFARGVHPKVVQEMMGHESIKITLDTYSHWIKGIQGGASEALGDVF